MTVNAFKGNVSIVDEATMNNLLTLHDFALIYFGNVKDARYGSGVYEFDCSAYNHAIYFTASNTTTIGRIGFDVYKRGEGADLVVQIRSGLNIDGSTDGVLLREMCYPKEFIPTSMGGWISVPIDLTGLTSGAKYWIVVKQVGDAINHFRLVGEASKDANYPCYRRAGDTGGWTQVNSIHFEVFADDVGDLIHAVYGQAFTHIIWSGELPAQVRRYVPPIDGYAGGVRDIMNIEFNGEYLKRGNV